MINDNYMIQRRRPLLKMKYKRNLLVYANSYLIKIIKQGGENDQLGFLSV